MRVFALKNTKIKHFLLFGVILYLFGGILVWSNGKYFFTILQYSVFPSKNKVKKKAQNLSTNSLQID